VGEHYFEKLDGAPNEGNGLSKRQSIRKSLLEDVEKGKITDPSRILTITKGKSIIQHESEVDSDDSD
jgi:hypothetical protein